MSTARLIVEDYSSTGTWENENTIITDYWLSFVAARDDRGKLSARKPILESDLRQKLQDFSRRMETLVENQAKLHQAIRENFPNMDQDIHATMLELKSRFSSGNTTPQPAMKKTRTRQSSGDDGPGLYKQGKSYFADRLRNSSWYDIISGRA